MSPIVSTHIKATVTIASPPGREPNQQLLLFPDEKIKDKERPGAENPCLLPQRPSLVNLEREISESGHCREKVTYSQTVIEIGLAEASREECFIGQNTGQDSYGCLRVGSVHSLLLATM
jgi:hypothetical protein